MGHLFEVAGQSCEVGWVWEAHKLMRIKAMVTIMVDFAEPTGSSEPNHYPVLTSYQHTENQMHLFLSLTSGGYFKAGKGNY